MQLFFVILIFIAVMTLCYFVGMGLDARYPGSFRKRGEFWDDSEAFTRAREAREQSNATLDDKVYEDPATTPAVDAQEEPRQQPEAGAEPDEVIRDCIPELLPESEAARKLAEFARLCAENIARSLGGNVVDVSAFVFEEDLVDSPKPEQTEETP